MKTEGLAVHHVQVGEFVAVELSGHKRKVSRKS